MLVPSMTMAEIRKEMEKDFPILQRKSLYMIQDLSRARKKSENKSYFEVNDYLSKYKNKWLYKIAFNAKVFHTAYLAYYYNDIGLVAIEPLPSHNYLIFYTTHFFKRYNERLHLNIVKPYDILRHYVEKHMSYNIKPVEELSQGMKKVFGISSEGILLGTYNDELRFYKMNTFLTSEMLKGNQIEEKNVMQQLLDKHVKDAEWE